MISINKNYNQYFRFIDEHLPGGFLNIDRADPVLLELEETTVANDQFFCLFDLIQLKFLFTSQRSFDMMGIMPDEINPSSFYKSVHPDDMIWHNIIQTRIFRLGQRLFIQNYGNTLVSTNLRFKKSSGEYMKTLVQCYLFFTEVPYKTVFILQVVTDISWFMRNTPGFHFYCGKDTANFRYPDEQMLHTGSVFTNS